MQFCAGLLITCLLISADSQTTKPFVFQNGAFRNVNPNQIYFNNDMQEPSRGVLPVLYQTTNRPNISIQQQAGTQAKPLRPDQNGIVVEPYLQTTRENDERFNDLGNKNGQANFTSNLSSNGANFQYKKEPQTKIILKKDAVDGITNFGVKLFQKVNNLNTGNIVISPYSITMLLALLQQGAKETTLEQISTALQLSSNTSAEIYARITDDVLKRNSHNILRTANNIFVASSFNINTEFLKIAINNFKSEITQTSFVRPDLAARFINNWVANRTNNKIDKLVSPDSLSDNTQMVLANAVYFKGLWQIPFRPELTLSRPFEVSRGVIKPASFMRTRRRFKCDVDSYTGSSVIILPFESDQYSLMIMLPSPLSDVDRDLSMLSVQQLASYHNITSKDVELELPKFTVKADIDLVPVFTKLGITNIFSQRSELYGLGNYRTSSPQVSSALHSAVLSIDEQGGSAAAATAFNVVALSYDDAAVKFIVNRPFIAVLWDSATSLPLFMAKVVDPVY